LNSVPRAGDAARLDVDVKAKSHRNASGKTRLVLREIAFTLDAGQVGAILGPSGCGKTTLLRIVAGLDKRFDGAVTVGGRLAVVFQEPRLLPWRTVEDNVRLAAPEVAASELAELFATLGLAEHRAHFPGELSLGLARRVALARALAARPDLLLLDEPLASLDATTAARLIAEITSLVEARSVTTLMVTHDVEAAIKLADVVYVLSEAPARLVARIEISEPRRGLTSTAAAGIATRVEAAREAGAKVALVEAAPRGA
jgi:ABC-type nitrate/sulfonate/bicarbonate transport system ATPase subunit